MGRRLAIPVALACALLALFELSEPAARAEDVSATVSSVLADKRYRFCHEEDYPLAPDEHDWCPLLGQYSGACPALPHACKLPPVDRRLSLPWSYGGGRRHARAGDAPAAAAGADDERARPTSCSRSDSNMDLSAMSAVARFVFFAMIGAFVIFVARLVAKNLVRSRKPPQDEQDEKDRPAEQGAELLAAPRGPVETDVERLLNRARAEAANGDYQRAVDDAYAALLRRLDGDGLIEIHASRTNGDYVRSLSEKPELRAAVRAIVRDVEDVQFGATPPSESVFRAVLDRVLPIASRVAAVGLLLVGLGASVSCGDSEGGSADSGFAGTSPSGTQAIIEVMSKHGLDVRHRSEPLAKLSDPLTLVLYPDAYLDEAAWKDLLTWVRERGGTLILAGLTPPATFAQRIVDAAGEATTLHVAKGNRWAGHPTVSVPGGASIQPASMGNPAGVPQTPPADATSVADVLEGAVLLRGDTPVLTDRAVGKGRVVLVADERLFMNASLTADDNATFLLSLLFHVTPVSTPQTSPADSPSSGAQARVVELVDAWTGAGSKTPIEAMDRAKLTPLLVQLLVVMVLLFLWKGVAFARLRDPPETARRAFVDHARALGLAYRRSRASRHAATLYASWALDRLRERVHGPGKGGLIPLSEAIAARTGQTEAEVMRVLVDAATAREEGPCLSGIPGRGPVSMRSSVSSRRQERGQEPPKGPKGAPADTDRALVEQLIAFVRATGSTRTRLPHPRDPDDPK